MEPDPPTVVIVEDHDATRRFLADNLSADGFEPLEAETARAGLRLMATRAPHLAIVDLGLPDRDGLEVLREVRTSDETASRIDPRLPMILLTGRSGELDRVRGFERGCDDYLVKPFSYPELRGRIGAILRRSALRPGAGRLKVGPLEVDPLARRVELDGRTLSLSKKEFALLRALAAEPARVFTHVNQGSHLGDAETTEAAVPGGLASQLPHGRGRWPKCSATPTTSPKAPCRETHVRRKKARAAQTAPRRPRPRNPKAHCLSRGTRGN